MADTTDPWIEQFEERRRERAAANRKIRLADETLIYRPSVAPEVGLRLQQVVRESQEEIAENEAREKRGEKTIDNLGRSNSEILEAADWTVRSCLEPSSVEAWERLRSLDHPEPLTSTEIIEFAFFIQARASGLPTGRPTVSPGGPQPTGTTAKGGSSSPADKPTRARPPRPRR